MISPWYCKSPFFCKYIKASFTKKAFQQNISPKYIILWYGMIVFEKSKLVTIHFSCILFKKLSTCFYNLNEIWYTLSFLAFSGILSGNLWIRYFCWNTFLFMFCFTKNYNCAALHSLLLTQIYIFDCFTLFHLGNVIW